MIIITKKKDKTNKQKKLKNRLIKTVNRFFLTALAQGLVVLVATAQMVRFFWSLSIFGKKMLQKFPKWSRAIA